MIKKRNLPTLLDPDTLQPLFGKSFLSNFFEAQEFEVDITETDKEMVVKCSIPGVTKENINIEFKEHVLSISCERKETTEEKGKTYRKEIVYGKMQRSFSLPEPVKEDTVKAVYKDGILTITLEKIVKTEYKKINIE